MNADENLNIPDEDKNGKSLAYLDLILRSVKDLRFGTVEIFVHDSKVVQIEIKEKVRFS